MMVPGDPIVPATRAAKAPNLRRSRTAAVAAFTARLRTSGLWQVSLPLLAGVFVYLYSFSQRKLLLADGDTYWHIAAGRWMLEHRTIPTSDAFSHTMYGAPWTAHEWLAEIVLAGAFLGGGWTLVTAVTSLAFALAIAMLAGALLRWLEPVHVLGAATLAVLLAVPHLLARPHVLVMPLLVLWVTELVRARQEDRTPGIWLLPVMALWANMHGGFTFGLALACALAGEAVFAAKQRRRAAAAARWGVFLALAFASALLNPQGPHGLWFTWQVLFEDSYALTRIGEWQSPNFHRFQPLEVWLLGALAIALHRGLRLPPVRLLLLLALIHLSLKHIRNVELLGLVGPLLLAPAFASQWRRPQETKQHFEAGDRLFGALSRPAGAGATLLAVVLAHAVTLAMSQGAPLALPDRSAPGLAVRAAQDAHINGPVLNDYGWGGYLILIGIPPFIDGRADVYGNAFIREYVEAVELKTSGGLETLLARHGVAWTLLAPDRPAAALLDRLPGWRRLYTDATAVVHVRTPPGAAARQPGPIDSSR